jgi:hypothetical protein
MPLTDLLAPQAVVPALRVNSKKQALQELAARAAAMCGRSEREVLDVLIQRERLGSTGIGGGIAIPHGKLAKLDRLFGAFARLERPVDFEALDGQPIGEENPCRGRRQLRKARFARGRNAQWRASKAVARLPFLCGMRQPGKEQRKDDR